VGSGGIGGLLARSHGYASTNGNWYAHNFYHADGNGNITYLVDSGQTAAASYRYDAYGNIISSSGSLAAANTYRFSSKMVDDITGMYYYGYRWYAPYWMRWLNRDPIGEEGFELLRKEVISLRAGEPNRYRFVLNDPVNGVDPYGLFYWKGIVGGLLMVVGGAVILHPAPSMPAKIGGMVCFVGGAALVVSEVIDARKEINKLEKKIKGIEKDSDGDGIPDRMDPYPDDPTDGGTQEPPTKKQP